MAVTRYLLDTGAMGDLINHRHNVDVCHTMLSAPFYSVLLLFYYVLLPRGAA